MTDLEVLLEENHLVYVTDTHPGITRVKEGTDLVFYDRKQRKIEDHKVLERIKKLVLPPAWENVWIAEKANAHLQATGIDQAGRKQYRYHSSWSASRNESKYHRLLEFGQKLKLIRQKLEKDIRHHQLDERKVLAISVSLMQKTLIRVGNESYKQLYGSYGLSTLRDKHVKIEGKRLRLSFKGKKGVFHNIVLNDARLAKLVKSCRDIPGQELFQYYTETGERKSIDSGQINRYLREIADCDFTAKDFRTWSGTMEALRSYAVHGIPETESARKKVTVAVLDEVSAKLGNTRSVCKKYYVFPSLIAAFEKGTLLPYLKKMKKNAAISGDPGLDADEKVLLSFLKAERNSTSPK